MIIKDLSKNEKRNFNELAVKDVFKYDGRIFMKAGQSNEEINAFDFTKVRLTRFTEDTEVVYVPAELILHERGWKPDKKNGEAAS